MNLRALKPHFPRNGIEVGLLRRERAAEVQTIACHRQCLQRLAAAESPAACAPIARAKVLPAHGLPHNRAAQTMRVRKKLTLHATIHGEVNFVDADAHALRESSCMIAESLCVPHTVCSVNTLYTHLCRSASLMKPKSLFRRMLLRK